MAVEAEDDLAESPEPKKVSKKKSGIKKILIIVFSALLLIGLGAGVSILVVNSSNTDESEETDAASTGKKGAKKESKKEPLLPPIYVPFEKPFVVNFEENGTMHYLQIEAEIMTRDPVLLEHIKTHMPIIRNNLVLLFSSQTMSALTTREGKEKLRAQSLAELQKIMTEQTGKPGVEAIYFTSFVMQ